MTKEPRIPVKRWLEVDARVRRSVLRVAARRFGVSDETVQAVAQRFCQGGVTALVTTVIRVCWIRATNSAWRVVLNLFNPGLTLTEYAEAKNLDPGVLRSWGVCDTIYRGKPAVRLPYYDEAGNEAAVNIRLSLPRRARGDDRFRPQSGWPLLYGLNRLDRAQARGYVALVEGESDCHTLWWHGEPAIGVPRPKNWMDSRDAPRLEGIATVYVVIEPNKGGATLRARLSASMLRDHIKLVSLSPFKDVSALYCDNPEQFRERWVSALAAAVPLVDVLNAGVGADGEAEREPSKTPHPTKVHCPAASSRRSAAC